MEYIYAALLLHKLGKTVNEENLKKIISATGAEIDEEKIRLLVASLKDVDIEKELEKAVSIAPTVSSEDEKPKAKEEKKEEKKEESAAAEGLSSLFG